MGYYIDEKRVSTNPKKLEIVEEWPIPANVKQLKGFLALTRYYRRFVRKYEIIGKPLTNLLKKDAFAWSPQAQEAFDKLKNAMITVPTLALPDFTNPFVVEIDACLAGIGVVLTLEGHPIAFVSKALAKKNLSLSVYDKELMSIVHAVERWMHCLT